jgi:RNA polymerase sigma-70 factor (ECF subfamily)
MSDCDLPDWESIVSRHAERVLRVAQRILGSVQDAEDVSQDVFAEAFRLHRAGPVQSWTGLLVRLATLRAIDRLRRKRAVVEVRETDRVTTVEPIDEAAARELADWLRQSLAKLPDQQAAVFAMCYFERLSHDDVARALGMSLQGVSTALYKARQRLMDLVTVFQRGTEK